jgi:hypothetical protein
MKKIYLFISLLGIAITALAQPVYTLTNKDTAFINAYGVLPDSGYPFNRVLTDSTLHFVATDTLWQTRSTVYWVRFIISNPSEYSRKYQLSALPFFDNTLYYYDQDAKKWIDNRTGVLTPVRARVYGMAPCIIRGGTDTVYMRINLSSLAKQPGPGFVRSYFLLVKEEYFQQREQLVLTICLATVLIVLIFLLYNAIIYYNTRDRAYLYYLLIQLGGIIYSIAAISGFNYLIPWQGFTCTLKPEGLYYFNLNMFCNRFSTVLIICSYVQFARYYLQTKQQLPRLDKWVMWITIAWAVFDLAHSLLNFLGLNQTDHVEIMVVNIITAIIVLLILAMAIAAKLRSIYAARYFLWSNLVSLALILTLAVYYIFNNGGQHKIWLPGAALVMQALMFAMALVARLRLMREQLASTKSEAEQLKTDIEQLEQQHQQLTAEHNQIEAAMQQEKSRNDVLEDKLAANNRQLASATLYIVQKNELLTQLKSNIKILGKKLPHGSKDLDSIESNLQSNQFLDNDWDKFKLHFEQVHPRFFEELKAKYPGLTQNETRLCAYFHMNLGTKEIAGLLNIDPASVRRAKTRLNKKMNGALTGNNESMPFS